jgi:hypothetical protein
VKIQSSPNSRPASALGQTKVAAPVVSQTKNSSTIAKKPVAKPPINNTKTPSKTEKRTNNSEIEIELMRAKEALGDLEKERDFYLWKLRDIDTLCQQYESENLPALKKIVEILYSTIVICFFIRRLKLSLLTCSILKYL